MRKYDIMVNLGDIGEFEALVEYDIEGSYYPATLTSPEEKPYIEISRITVDVDGTELEITDLVKQDWIKEEIQAHEEI